MLERIVRVMEAHKIAQSTLLIKLEKEKERLEKEKLEKENTILETVISWAELVREGAKPSCKQAFSEALYAKTVEEFERLKQVFEDCNK